ncbi:hypothetical protein WR25_10087 isoform B [Diploscapter pachys]|uniref:Uncharacterized protein n=1 Tax=Diploscapter pachys TaxID=2018661 RepID=A0A2A2LFJ1_9BILA|nr:hypothetical protein WR25_10087 isoform A [Diploscapter pachys]PAV84838.1 hypothetical protein WR25_10087 isoform B [Diploscapter pachys]
MFSRLLSCLCLPFLFLFILRCSLVAAYDEHHKPGPKVGFESDDNVITETTHYIPLGNNYIFPCEAVTSAGKLRNEQNPPIWMIFYPEKVWNGGLSKTELRSFNPNSLQNVSGSQFPGTTDRFLSDGENLYGYALQSIHNKVIIECQVKLWIGNRTVISRHFIQMQNCGNKTDSINLLDPCRYGTCEVDNYTVPGMEYTRCHCVPQYTGQKVRMMRIARHIVPMDRKKLTHEYLFPASIYAKDENKLSSAKAIPSGPNSKQHQSQSKDQDPSVKKRLKKTI